MEIKRESIRLDHASKQFIGDLQCRIAEYNPMMTKAKMEFLADVMEGVFKVIEAKEAEFLELYGQEVIRHAYHVPASQQPEIGEPTTKKYVQSKEVQQNLLEKAFKE